MKSFGSIFSDKSFSSPLMKGVSAALAVEACDQVLSAIFTPVVLNHARAAYVKNGVLALACLNSTVAQEIRFREDQIIKQINEKLPSALIKKIRYLS